MVSSYSRASCEISCQRICCPMFRGFTMSFTDGAGATFFTLTRPFNCDPCYCPPCCMCKSQEISMVDARGAPLASAHEVPANCRQCCSRTFVAAGRAGEPVFILRASECGTVNGHNCCAPSCFNHDYEAGCGRS